MRINRSWQPQIDLKADKSYVDTQLSNVDASPKGVYATLELLQTAFPLGTDGIYLVTADGKWYYWNGSAWTAGSIYQSTGIADKAITSGKTAFQQIPFTPNFEIGYYINRATGVKISIANNYHASDFIDFDYAGIAFIIKTCSGNDGSGLSFYDKNKVIISGVQTGTSTSVMVETAFTVPANTKYIRFTCFGATNIGNTYIAISDNSTVVANKLTSDNISKINLKSAENQKSFNDLNNTLSTNVNQRATMISSGNGTFSLDKNAVNDRAIFSVDGVSTSNINTVGTGRIRIYDEDETQHSELYYEAKLPLRSVPAIADKIQRSTNGNHEHVKNVSSPVVSTVVLTSLAFINVDAKRIFANTGVTGYDSSVFNTIPSGAFKLFDSNNVDVPQASYAGGQEWVDNVSFIGKCFATSSGVWIVVEKGSTPTINHTLTFKLATPVVTPIKTSGTLLSCPSGVVKQENAISVIGVYKSTGISVKDVTYPINTLEKIVKLDYDTGVETELAIASATIASGGLSFTHTELAISDIVSYSYLFTGGTVGKTEIKYNTPYTYEGFKEDLVFRSFMIRKVLFIGDSLTAGKYYHPDVLSDIAESYPYYCGLINQWQVTNAGVSGINAPVWWDTKKDLYTYTNHDTFIIWLGTNEGYTDTLTTDTNYASYLDYANTNTGALCKIIEHIRTNHPIANIFLLGLFIDSVGVEHTVISNNVLAQIAAKYSIPLIPMNDGELSGVINHPFSNTTHFGKYGNITVAKKVSRYISKYIYDNPAQFENVYLE